MAERSGGLDRPRTKKAERKLEGALRDAGVPKGGAGKVADAIAELVDAKLREAGLGGRR